VDDTISDATDALDDTLTSADDSLSGTDDVLGDFLDDTGADDAAELADDSLDEFLADGSDVAEEAVDSVSDGIDGGVDDIESVIDDVVEETTVAPPVIEPEKPQSMIDKVKSMIFDGGLWKLLAGLGGLLVAGLVFLFFRRRRADEEFEISMLSI